MGDTRAAVGLVLILLVELSWGQRSRPASTAMRRRLNERLRRLDEQFRRFQKMTLTHLQSIADNYNTSYSMDTRVHTLSHNFEGILRELSSFRAATEQDLSSLKSWHRKLTEKTRRLERRLAETERAVKENARLARRQIQEHRAAMANLTQELGAQRGRIKAINSQQSKIHDSEKGFRDKLVGQTSGVQQPVTNPNFVSSRNVLNKTEKTKTLHKTEHTRKPKVSKDSRMKNRLRPPPLRPTRPQDPVPTQSQTVTQPEEEEQIHNVLHLPLRLKIPQNYTPKKAASICNVNSMLVFPSASIKNYVTFRSAFLTSVLELSVCTWLRVDDGYVGTLLSYATEDNDNTLVIYGHRSRTLHSLDFVLGDPAHRELTINKMLDGHWHHTCVIWSSIEGQFWHYIDHHLTSYGFKFQKGYEIPPGGSLILGQEQDSVGGGFDQAEVFVGRLAGFGMWFRVLSPGEVSGLASGKGIPRGAVLTLDDVDVLHGSVQQVKCACLEHCT